MRVPEVEARRELAEQFFKAGEYRKALMEYLWLFDEGMKQSPRYAGVRVSFLTATMGRLANEYRPAVKALKIRRDAAGGRILGDPKDRVAASEFAALSHALGDEKSVLDLLQRLPADDPRKSWLGGRVYWDLVKA